MKLKTIFALIATTWFASPLGAAATYSGNTNTGFGGPVGTGSLSITDDGVNLTFTFNRGTSGDEADTLGYAIRKKKSDVLRAQKDKFVRQAAERGVEARVIDAVFKAFEPFERYGFNKAHATCYGLIAYQTAYLKANYPVEYMTSVLTAFRDNTDKVAGAIAECRRLGIEVLGPDVRHSFLDFTVEGTSIPSVSGCWPSRTWRGRHPVDHRCPRGRWSVRVPG